MYTKEQLFKELQHRLKQEIGGVCITETDCWLHASYQNEPLCEIDYPSRIMYRPGNTMNPSQRAALDRVIHICEKVSDYLEAMEEEIETASFVQEKENLVLMGAVGTGKTHLATAVALSLCEKGRHVRFFTATGLANILQEKHQRGTLTGFMNSLRRVELLVLDEIGFVTLHKEASEPKPYEWSEQDIMVQIKNYLGCGEFEKSMKLFTGERLILPDGVEF